MYHRARGGRKTGGVAKEGEATMASAFEAMETSCASDIPVWLRDAFPGAGITPAPGGYLELRHRLGEGAEEDPELSRLTGSGLLIDLETLGFLGRPLFLIGLFRRDGDGVWEVAQLLARDYAEEEAVLEAFAREARERPLWISFNGKAFDVPVLRNRAAYYGLRLPAPDQHQDLLHVARRVYRGVLPNCRLKTLEWRLFGRARSRDLDGWSIPAAYHEFVRTGRGEDMVRILRHNRDDLATLARLHVHLQEP